MQDKIWICDDEPSTRFPVYTRANVGEVWAPAVTPLTWTTFDRLGWEAGFREALYEMGKGNPRAIDHLARRALEMAHRADTDRVGAQHVIAARATLQP